MRAQRTPQHSTPCGWAGRSLAAALMSAFLLGCAPHGVSQSEFRTRPQKNLFALRTDGGYDYNTFFVDGRKANLEGVLQALFVLKTVTEFEGGEGKIYQTGGYATGVVIFERFVLTVDHAVSDYELKIPLPYGKIVIPARKKKQETYIVVNGEEHLLRALVRDRNADIALFRLPDELQLPSFPYNIGNSDDLKIGNFIYVVGNPLNMGFNVREGIVSNLRAPEVIHTTNALPDNTFMVSNGLNPGDSGTPAIAIRDGAFELVGLTQGTFLRGQRLGWILRINAIMDKIRPHVGPVQTAHSSSF